jgi:hypothetical protein
LPVQPVAKDGVANTGKMTPNLQMQAHYTEPVGAICRSTV